jgi:23S rRNA pseudouridine1911/1915/1917 synthase
MSSTPPSPAPGIAEHAVPAELEGRSLAAGVKALFQLSWSQARDAVSSGKISVDGAICSDTTLRLRPAQVLSLNMNARRRDAALDPIADAIVHVDHELVVVNKPTGLNSVPFEEERGSLKELVFRCLSRLERGHRSRPGRESLAVVHRLDRETTGLLVFARTWAARDSLKEQFREHSVHRLYLAIVHGQLARDQMTVRSHLLRDRGDGIRGSAERAAARPVERGRPTSDPRSDLDPQEGKLAITHVEARERLFGATFCRCRLETGRTHQIRIHLSESGYPLVGERVYTRDFHRGTIPSPRVMLHAAELGLVHPATGETFRWSAPVPADMEALLEKLRRPPPRGTPRST